MNFYNDNDPKAAAWLRELIAGGHIAQGIVDERSIEDVRASELSGYVQCHFFAGIGGWSLALRLAGWPDDRPVWTGSCPCQPFSCAGRGRGTEDARHLWPQFRRLISESRPPVCFGEQVASKAGRSWLAGVRADLEDLGYSVGAADLCAAGAGAPHIRQRLYWAAESEHAEWRPKHAQHVESHGRDGFGRSGYVVGLGNSGGTRLEKQRGVSEASCGAGGTVQGQAAVGTSAPASRMEHAALPESTRLGQQRVELFRKANAWSDYFLLPCLDGKTRRVESGSFPLAHGVPGRVGLLRGYGNAIVPQVASEFIAAVIEIQQP